MKRSLRAISFAIAISVLLAFLGSVAWSKVYWGYFFQPPRIDARIATLAKVVSVSKFWRFDHETKEGCFTEFDLTFFHESKTPPSFSENPQNRILYALREADLLPSKADALPEKDVRHVVSRLDVDTDFLWGLLVVAEDQSGTTNIFFSGESYPVDHRSYCELLAKQDASGRLDRVSYQIFHFDTAGLEGTTWLVAFGLLAATLVPTTILTLTVVFMIHALIQKRRKRHPTTESDAT